MFLTLCTKPTPYTVMLLQMPLVLFTGTFHPTPNNHADIQNYWWKLPQSGRILSRLLGICSTAAFFKLKQAKGLNKRSAIIVFLTFQYVCNIHVTC